MRAFFMPTDRFASCDRSMESMRSLVWNRSARPNSPFFTNFTKNFLQNLQKNNKTAQIVNFLYKFAKSRRIKEE